MVSQYCRIFSDECESAPKKKIRRINDLWNANSKPIESWLRYLTGSLWGRGTRVVLIDCVFKKISVKEP